MADLNKIIDDLSGLTVVEAAELSKQLEEKWGVTAATAVAATPVAGAAPAEINITVKSSLASSAAPPAAGAGAAAAIAVTPHFSSSCFESSAASTTVKLDKSSIILFRSGIFFFTL